MHTDYESKNPQKNIFIKDLKPQDSIQTTLLVKSKNLNIAKNSKPYLCLLLGDRTGEIDSRVWENAESMAELFREGDVVAISGRAHKFNERLQLVVNHLIPVPAAEVELGDYLPASPADTEVLYQELIAVFEKLDNPWVRDLSLRLLRDPEIESRYKRCPAAKTIHHAFIGGLLTHVMSLARLVDVVAPLYPVLDRNLLMFGVAFHDFGKIFELSYQGPFAYTDEGRLVGHISIGCNLIDREIQKISGFPKDLEYHLKHLVLAHHGKLEYGSPKRPATIEALVVNYLDDMDSKIDSISSLMRADKSGTKWTGYHKAYDQYYMKSDKILSASASDE